MELHAVAHRDLDLAPVMVEAPVRDLELRRDVAPRRHGELLRGVGGGSEGGGNQQEGEDSGEPAGNLEGSEGSHGRFRIVHAIAVRRKLRVRRSRLLNA